MHQRGAIADLMWRKAGLRAQIAARRAVCAQATAEIAVPLRWIDRAWLAWRETSPLARAGISFVVAVLGRRLARRRRGRGVGWFSALSFGIRLARNVVRKMRAG